jgi:hypothetical protein
MKLVNCVSCHHEVRLTHMYNGLFRVICDNMICRNRLDIRQKTKIKAVKIWNLLNDLASSLGNIQKSAEESKRIEQLKKLL